MSQGTHVSQDRSAEVELLRRQLEEAEAIIRTLLQQGDDSVAGSLPSASEELALAQHSSSVRTMAAGLAHEISDSFAGVTANLDLALRLLTRPSEGGPAELSELLRRARAAADKVGQVIRNLRTLAGSEDAGRVPLDVRLVLESVLRTAEGKILPRARLARTYRDVPLVLANESRLSLVFLNLLLNAVQALPEGNPASNQIAVGTALDPCGRVAVTVRDTGSGIPAHVLPRIFTPYFTTRPVGSGPGLGLSLSSGIVASLGGEIGVDTSPGVGTTFTVLLPPAVLAEPEAPVESESSRRGRILIVDDDPILGRTIERILRLDHDVTVASDGREVLSLCRRGARYDVILCDLMMPEVTGMDLHVELCRLAPDQAARMVFMTGGAFTARARAFLEAVSNLRIFKPFDLAELRAVVRERVG